MAGTGYYGHLTITLGELRGAANVDPALEIVLKVHAAGFAPGVSAMILATCHAQGPASNVVLGQAETIITQIGFGHHEGGGKPYATSEMARWHLSPTAIEHLESVRDGKGLTFHVTSTVVLLNHGESLQDVNRPPIGISPPNVYPHSPIWHAGQERLEITAEAWATQALIPWQQAAAVTLIVKLPVGTATDDHRTVIRELTEARHRLDAGDWKGSIRSSRDSAEVLRSMYGEHLNPKKTLRTVTEREVAIIDSEIALIQALYSYGSATHPDPGLRETAWTREHAVLILVTTAAVAQRLFSAMIRSTT